MERRHVWDAEDARLSLTNESTSPGAFRLNVRPGHRCFNQNSVINMVHVVLPAGRTLAVPA